METSRRSFIGTSLAFAVGVGCASACRGEESAQVLPFGSDLDQRVRWIERRLKPL